MVSLKSSSVSVGNPQIISVAIVMPGTFCLSTLTTRQKSSELYSLFTENIEFMPKNADRFTNYT